VGAERARAIQALARTSIASACTDTDAATIVRLVERIRMLLDQERQIGDQLERFAAQQPPAQPATSARASAHDAPDPGRADETGAQADIARQIRVANSMPGIGLLSASTIVLRCGGVRRYTSAKAFAAQMGACPERNQTGSTRDTARLTRRGDRRARAILFLCVMAACRTDPAMRFHQWRLRRAGLTPKQALCACMNRHAKLLWHLVTTNTDYDPQRSILNAQKHHPKLWKTFVETVLRTRTNHPIKVQRIPTEALI
jgi:transposase